jgi:Bax protein
VNSAKQVQPLQDSLVRPILYKNLTGFATLSQPEAKQKFIAAILPSVLVAKHNMEMDRLRLQELYVSENWSSLDSVFFFGLCQDYRSKSFNELLYKMGSLPNSIVLAQAAVETGWGQSRFLSDANNVFGIWSFDDDETRIAAVATRDDKTVFLRAYPTIQESISDYFKLLGTSGAFKRLRLERTNTTDPYKLLPFLKLYSERKGRYTTLLKTIIRQNNLTQYDNYSIHPDFLLEDN